MAIGQTLRVQPMTQNAIIERKLRVPLLSETVVARPRVRRLLAERFASHRIVILAATAGAGKSTAVVDASRQLGWPVAWLTMDRSDVQPGRLLTYLEAALAQHVPEVDGLARQMLTSGIPRPEAAGMLAEAVAGRQLVLVLDELERLEQSTAAWAVIESLLRYAPSSMRIVMLSRRDVPVSLCELPPTRDVAWIREADLAFTVPEAEEALATAGAAGIDAELAVDVTGGWVTGVLFEAWRSADHVYGMGGEMDPLHGYLAAHVLGRLSPEDQEFLVVTSLLDEVSAPRARALGQRSAGEQLERLRSARLPVTWHPDRQVMTCHSRFREYLLACLERRDEGETRDLRLAYGRLLAREGHDEEAVEELLRAGALDEALTSAERVISEVIARLDLQVGERWLASFASLGPSATSRLALARLMLALVLEDFDRGVETADELAALGKRAELTRSSDRAAALMAWCYVTAGMLDEFRVVLSDATPGPMVDAAAYLGNVFLPLGGAARPDPADGELVALVQLVDFHLGRLSELADTSGSRWSQTVAQPWRIAALRASGKTRPALELYEAARDAGSTSSALLSQIGPEILIDAGRYDEARGELARARRVPKWRTSPWVWVESWLTEMRIVLRADRDPAAARRILGMISAEAQRTPYHSEWFDTWFGYMLLLEGDDADARERLDAAVTSMAGGDRMLHMPTAAIYLAEAEWRCGNYEAADRAALRALQGAHRQGSNHLLLQALADVPGVVSRQISSSPAGSPWHDLGRALIAQRVALEVRVGALVKLYEFGAKRIVVDGEEVRPTLSKSYELLAYLASAPSRLVTRDELLDALFDGRTDDAARAYLRQAVRKLRQSLPDGDMIIVEDGGARLRDDTVVDTESARFQEQVAEAARLQHGARRAATLVALQIADRGEYLPEVQSPWADDRRQQLMDMAQNARCEAAELAFADGDFVDADRRLREVLRIDPYREVAWRLSMRLARALGDEDAVVRVYRDCERALADIGATPTHATQTLFAQVRH